MKEQDKTPEKQLNEVVSRKRIQNNDNEDDPGPWKKNGGKDQEDACLAQGKEKPGKEACDRSTSFE